jgi:hypothetical protein
MKTSKRVRIGSQCFFALVALLMLTLAGIPASGQSTLTQPRPVGPPTIQPQDNDTKPWQVAAFDKFLDGHPEVAEQLRANPSLVNNEEFVENHPALQQYLQQHPGIREEISENPRAFMNQEARFEQREEQREGLGNREDRDVRTQQLAAFDRFLDSHPELSEQLRKNPSLVNNEEFVENHPGLQQFLQEHPGIREEISENPRAFMRQEERFDRREELREGREDGDRDQRLHGVVVFDRFLDRHPELAEQLRKNPSLVSNQEFLENHPALQQFLRDNPGVGTEINENPRAFMHEEERFDRQEDRFNQSDDRTTTTVDRDERATTTDRDEPAATGDRDGATNQTTLVGPRAKGSSTGMDNDTTTAELASADRFLDSHPEIAEQLSKNPSLINDKDFVKHHPALQDYLKRNPEVREEMRENPSAFMRQEARFDQREALFDRNRDRGDMASFSTFLGAHASLAQQLSKNPSLANNKEFQASHPELQEFLKTHPTVQTQLTANPQTVMSTVQASNAAAGSTGKPASTAKPPSTTKPPAAVKPPGTTKPEVMH